MTWRTRSDMTHIRTALIVGLIILAIWLMFFFYEPENKKIEGFQETETGYQAMNDGRGYRL